MERSMLMAKNNSILEDVVIETEGSYREFQGEESISEELPDTWTAFRRYKSGALKGKKEELERRFIEKLLIKHNGNISQSARKAGIDRRQLQDMIKALGIDTSLFKEWDG
jgi:DNA-binding NtrC family response regulator